jgi:vancomycin resistance protein YoaR
MQSTLASPPVSSSAPFSVWLARLALAVVFIGAIFLAAGLAGAALFSMNYRQIIYPGVSAWGVDLSGRSPAGAAVALTAAFTYSQQPAITFIDIDTPNGKTWTATPAQLGLRFDLAATVAAAYDVGRSGNPLRDAFEMFGAWYAGRQVSPVLVYNGDQAQVFLNGIAQQVFAPTVEATLAANGNNVSTTPGQIGRQLDVLATAAAVRPALLSLSRADIPLKFIQTPPRVLDASAQAAAAKAILSQPLTLTITQPVAGDPGSWTIDQAALGSMLQVRRVADSANAAHYQVGLDPAGLRSYLQPLSDPLRKAAVNARFTFNDTTQQLELAAPSQAARDLDVDATIAAIDQALAAGAHSVPLAFKITPPQVTDDATAAQLGITQLVSQQSTYFVGSSAERVHNITTAGARFHGLLVAPNATFSFDDNLGDVSLDSGFAEALIIFGGRTIQGVGGGVCQVSTTVFRAAYFGGFPIVLRYSHAYRVGYYERGDTWKGPGLDATVYAPLVDFQFKNDTPYWLLMEVYVDPAASRITWKFYSTSDGRKVTVSQPNIQNVVPAPDPLYEENTDLAAGQIKQTDYAADGADVSVSRVIMRAGAQINADEAPISTHYEPWRAVFDYGPGTQGIPTPQPTASPTP